MIQAVALYKTGVPIPELKPAFGSPEWQRGEKSI
jgi:hypothetical protein